MGALRAFEPFTVDLQPGRNTRLAAERLARLIIDRWMLENRGGVHLLVTPRLATAIEGIYDQAGGKTASVRVTHNGAVPVLTVL